MRLAHALPAAALLALTGCSSATPAAAPSPTLAPDVQVECVNVERAYNAWKGSHAYVDSADKVLALTPDTYKWTTDEGTKFADALRGYPRGPVGEVSIAAAEYNVKLGLATLPVAWTPPRPMEAAAAADVATAVTAVHKAYADYRKARCTP